MLHNSSTTLPKQAEHDSATACCRVRNTSTKHWMPEEDKLLTQLVLKHGAQAWSFIASHFDGRHPGKSCRLRWLNQLDPGVNREPFSEWEDAVIVRGAEVSFQGCSLASCLQAFSWTSASIKSLSLSVRTWSGDRGKGMLQHAV